MNVTGTEKTGQTEIRHTIAVPEVKVLAIHKGLPKTARLKIINGRPYYYEITNVWSRADQRCHQKSKYLGKELPKGYRLIK
ncbi:MAG: hypothetical protein ABIK32_04635 [Chloroflexota bacterium]